jgi:indolepyruvate ferredoxin oxidoreductase alpha subunit
LPPKPETLLQDKAGKQVLLLGNEAIARGVIEAGVGMVTTYPGTPASEIGDTVSKLASKAGIYMEYSVNEKVAVEIAAGAAVCGARALTAMKHVGLNVAADAVMTLAYIGVRGGYVIVTADDPECYSSQNEQDNRLYALLSNLPCLEPSNPQECKDMVRYAVQISEKLELPVLLRTVTRVSHTRGPVIYGSLDKPRLKGMLKRDVQRFVAVPRHARPMHDRLLEKVERAKEISESSPYNRIVRKADNGKIGIISSSAAYNYAVEAAELLRLNVSLLKLGMSHPLPEEMITQFLKEHEKIIVVEELEPYLEVQVKALAKDCVPEVEIYGKMREQYFPRSSEFSTRIVVEGLAKITGLKLPIDFISIEQKYEEVSQTLIRRPPVLCAGCPHRASFYVLKRATNGKALFPTDIGCYALGIAPPLSVGDLLICMGASIGTAGGVSKATGVDTIAIVGDSTFFHAGIPALVNAVYNNHKFTLVVVDNLTTAMTGNQPHPGTGKTGMGIHGKRVVIEEVARGCGVSFVKVINPFEVEEAVRAVKEALRTSGVSIVVFRAPCALLLVREKRRMGERLEPCWITEACNNCMACIKLLGCPALIIKNGNVTINEALCTGCGLCAHVCPYKAIRLPE